MSEDQAEIIARPPSHPIATTLIIVSMLATIFSIGLVWDELFSEYLPAKAVGARKIDPSHKSKVIADAHRTDHFAADEDFRRTSIEVELGGTDRPLSSTIGGGDGLDGG